MNITGVNHVVFNPADESIIIQRLMFNLYIFSSSQKVNSSRSVFEVVEVPYSGNPN